jgi:hypothetical protein
MPARRDSNRPILIALLMASVITLGVVFGPRLWRTLVPADAADPVDHAPAPPAPAMFEGVDLRHVHAELLPAWVSAQSQPEARKDEATAFTALAAAVQPSATLRETIETLRMHSAPERLLEPGNPEQLLAVVRRWNETIERAGVPYLLRANIGGAPRPFFYAFSCEVLADTHVTVAGAEHRVRLIRRVDRINMREWYLGRVSEQEEGVIIVLDNVVELAKDRIWPLLAPAEQLAALGPVPAVFAPAVQQEVSLGLSASHVELLRATASARAELVAAVTAMQARVTGCGGGLIVPTLPWNGFGEEELQRMRALVSDVVRCPAITTAEHEVLLRGSATLRETEGLEPAVEALAAWAARPIIVHEARHAADAADAAAGRARVCQWCEPSDPQPARMELSAYLAQLAWTDAPALSLYQLCHATAASPGLGHAEALAVIFDRADHYCEAGPLGDAAAVARSLELEAFGRSDAIELAGELPSQVPVRSLNLGR